MIGWGAGTTVAWSLAAVWEGRRRMVPPAFAHVREPGTLLPYLAVAGVGLGIVVARFAGLRRPRGDRPQPLRVAASDH